MFLQNIDPICDDGRIPAISGWSGVVLCNFFFFSPLALFIQLAKTGDKSHIPFLMLAANALNTLMWATYGLFGGGTESWVSSGIGLTPNSTYVIWYLLYCFDKSYKRGLAIASYVTFVTLALSIAIYGFFHHEQVGHPALGYVGWCASVINTLMYAAPGQNLYKVFVTKDHNLIPIVSSIVGLVNCICWSTYGLLRCAGVDYFIVFPNGIGIPIFVFQIITWGYFYRKSKENKKIQDSTENDLLQEAKTRNDSLIEVIN